ncbi:MAG: hypothetical protein ACRD4R_02370 [Candidatus Acidiferrales bacterium]
MESKSEIRTGTERTGFVALPTPTAAPFVLAAGMLLLATGLVTAPEVSVLGGALTIFGAIAWWRDLYPEEQHEHIPVKQEEVLAASVHAEAAGVESVPELKRAQLPLEIYPIAAGIRGGLVGSAAMALVAVLYGWVHYGSVWYPINLVGAIVFARELKVSPDILAHFNPVLFAVAVAIHVSVSVVVGLLYGALLPMLPRQPILLGGVFAPLLWSGAVHGVLGIVNPLLYARINWVWFVASQIAFGVVAGVIVIRHHRVRLPQLPPIQRHNENGDSEAPGASRGGGGS